MSVELFSVVETAMSEILNTHIHIIIPTALPKLRRGGLSFADVFKIYFNDFCQTSYLNIYQTDLHEIFRIGRTLAVDERSEVIFFDPSSDVAVATNFVGKIDLHSTPCSSYDIR